MKKRQMVQNLEEIQAIFETHFWKEHTFQSDGYFVVSIGNANEKTIQKYIEEQGNE